MDPNIRKRTLRLLSNGVYILTSRASDRFAAATVTWVSQTSFQPPLLAQKFFAPTSSGPGTINGEPFVEGETSAYKSPLQPLTIAQSPWEYGG